MAKVDTVSALLRPMMGRPSVKADRCLVCGAASPLDQHHVVPRSAGKAYDETGRELRKPTVTLCGPGNAGGCHGLAHGRKLHFRWAEGKNNEGHWEFLLTPNATKYQDALELDGWRRLGGGSGGRSHRR